MTTSNRPILSITRKEVKEIYWDIQVNGTHNYVTSDGAIHHNSTKTTASLMKIAYEASRVAPCRDGIRRSRVAVIRNTRQMLWDTTIPDFLKWYPEGTAGTLLRTESKFILKTDDIECEVLFRGLDDANDVRRLLSLQLSFGMMDEFREINPDIFNALTGRLGRYPDKTMNGVGCCEILEDGTTRQIHKVWGASNPPDADTFWEQYIDDLPENASATIQPSGLSPEADWLHCLPDDYYDNLCQGKTEDWIDVYVHGKFGKSLSGQPVFRCFSKETHVAKEPLKPIGSGLLVIGVDAGLNPSAVITQQTYDGRVVVLDALTGSDGGMGALRFARERLKPLLSNKYPGRSMVVIIDPAAFQRAQTDEKSVADILKAEGFVVKPARTNTITARLAAVEAFLTRTVDGKSAFLIDPGATLLIQALSSKYRYKINQKGERDDKPEKSHPWSDFCFVAGTPILTPSGYKPIESLRLGDAVCVHDGLDYIVATGSSNAHKLVRVELSDGTSIICTPDHPFILTNTCLLRADELICTDSLANKEQGKWANGQWRTHGSGQSLVRAYSAVVSLKLRLGAWVRGKVSTVARCVIDWAAGRLMVSSTMVCGSHAQGKTPITGTNGVISALSLCTGTYGSNTTAQYLPGTTYTTVMATPPTTTLATWSVCQEETTDVPTWQNDTSVESYGFRTRLVRLLKRGIGLKKGENGIGGTGSKSPLTAKRVVFLSEGGRVFNLTTARTHTYYAGSALVHNCDALQYACLQHDGGSTLGGNAIRARVEVKPAPMRWAA